MISIQIQTKQSIPLVTLAGRLDTTTSTEVDQTLKPVLEKQKFLIIDLSECTYLSSAGIRILLVAEKKLLTGGGKLFLSGLVPEVFQVLEMAGLHQVFRICGSPGAALAEIEQIQQKDSAAIQWATGDYSFQCQLIESKKEPALLWKNSGIAGYNELGISIGTGSPAETPEEEAEARGIFVTTGHCAGFIPGDPRQPSDFRIPKNPSHAGIFVQQALSFGKQPTCRVRLSEPASISIGELASSMILLKKKIASGPDDQMALVIASFNPVAPSVSVGLVKDGKLDGVRFVLGEVPDDSDGLPVFLEKNLTIVNIIRAEAVHSGDPVINPTIWAFISDGQVDASTRRLEIETVDNFLFKPHQAFLTRRLYTDSARLIIKKLHGGYSAQTYQVTSFDESSRKLRPTVLKMANRAMIARESERCQQYALPYILNNSAIVLGTEFFGDTGALRYNFVGIGGEFTQLKWLTYYYQTWPLDQLKPLFDKIFLQILNPWYGQPIRETIYPYRDHDPRATFFPRLCEIAAELFAVSPDDRYFQVPETGQQITNPYWFLKHEFARQRETAIGYYTSICHGDLNMQNILLDEDMNVYLIDFSETRPRSLISDFARLEAIFMVDFAPLDDESDLREYIKFISRFYANVQPGELPVNGYQGKYPDVVNKNYSLSLKMRQYATDSVNGDPNPVPYCLALLEWILPIVTYSSAATANKRVSMIVSGLICDQLMTINR